MALGIGIDNFIGRNDLTGVYNGDNVNDVLKAMTTSGYGRDYENSGNVNDSWGPLKYEVLDNVLHVLTYRAKNIVLWNAVPKSPCTSNIVGYNQLLTYGINQANFVSEGQIPTVNNLEAYMRRSVTIKYLSELKNVTSQAMQTNAMGGDVMNANVENATLNMLRTINVNLLDADETVIPQAWNGFNTIHRNHSNIQQLESYYQQNPLVINANGGILTENMLNQASLALQNQYAFGDMLFTSPSVIGSYNNQFIPQRIVLGDRGGTNTNGMNSGVVSNVHNSPWGPITLHADQFLTAPQGIQLTVTFAGGLISTITSPAPGQQAPLPPTATFLANTNDSVPGSWNRAANMNSLYVVRALNSNGLSAITTTSSFVAQQGGVATNSGAVTMTVLNNNAAIFPATGYVVYRTVDAASTPANFPANGVVNLTVYPILTVSANNLAIAGYNPPINGAGLAPNIIRDSNFKIPNTQEAFLVENNPQNWNFYQWLPMNKMDLAQTNDSRSFVIRMWGAPVLFAPNHYVRFMNLV